jgi:hypothetical protein
MATYTTPRPSIEDLRGAAQAHTLRRGYSVRAVLNRVPGALRGLLALALVATRAIVTRGGVTVRSARPYILTVSALACFAIAGFTLGATVGFVVTGAVLLWLNHGMERTGG